MAATKGRLTKHQQEQVRDAIKTSQLTKRLQCFALGEKDQWDKVVDLSPDQIRAIDILLRKTVPDLKAVEMSSDPDAPIKLEFSWKPAE